MPSRLVLGCYITNQNRDKLAILCEVAKEMKMFCNFPKTKVWSYARTIPLHSSRFWLRMVVRSRPQYAWLHGLLVSYNTEYLQRKRLEKRGKTGESKTNYIATADID